MLPRSRHNRHFIACTMLLWTYIKGSRLKWNLPSFSSAPHIQKRKNSADRTIIRDAWSLNRTSNRKRPQESSCAPSRQDIRKTLTHQTICQLITRISDYKKENPAIKGTKRVCASARTKKPPKIVCLRDEPERAAEKQKTTHVSTKNVQKKNTSHISNREGEIQCRSKLMLAHV